MTLSVSAKIVYGLNYQSLARKNPALVETIRRALLTTEDPMAVLQALGPQLHYSEIAEVMGATCHLAAEMRPAGKNEPNDGG